MIHPSHTTRYIYDLIKILNFDILDYECLSKNDLFAVFWEYIEKLDDIDGSVEELEHLKKYLNKEQLLLKMNCGKIIIKSLIIQMEKNTSFIVKVQY